MVAASISCMTNVDSAFRAHVIHLPASRLPEISTLVSQEMAQFLPEACRLIEHDEMRAVRNARERRFGGVATGGGVDRLHPRIGHRRPVGRTYSTRIRTWMR